MSLKVVKFDPKMYLDFSIFGGRTSAGGDKPWSKNGDKCRMGGDCQNFCQMGDPESPPTKKILRYVTLKMAPAAIALHST